MPAEEAPHEATWMCWPSTRSIWGASLPAVQQAIADIATTIAGFEPVTMLVRGPELRRVGRRLADADVELIVAPVDDLWARDTLPSFLLANDPDDAQPLALARTRFNGWGSKQIHGGDAQLARVVSGQLGVPLLGGGLVGEGGGLEVDGEGTVLASRSSWVNDNRNPGLSEGEIGERLVDLLGAERLIWVDGLAGEDITDGHIDTLARFAQPDVVVLDAPAFEEPGDVWFDVSVATREDLSRARGARGARFELVPLVQPSQPRGRGDEFLSSYVNYYVCNGAVICPAFGDPEADAAAVEQLAALYPDREIVALDIDPVAAGGGGIHCATRQQPRTR